MDISNSLVATLVALLIIAQTSSSAKGENTRIEQTAQSTKQDWNPLETIILHQNNAKSSSGKHEPTNESLTRVKRQYGRRYPYPLPVVIFGGGGFGRGFGGRGFGGGRGGFGGGRGGFGGGRGGFGGGGRGGGRG